VQHLLDDSWMLMRRAERQFYAIQAGITEFFKDNPADVVIDDDPRSGEKVVYFAEEPVLPREWGAGLGQFVSNARTALDHLIYALR
jgi:hypothetical protein